MTHRRAKKTLSALLFLYELLTTSKATETIVKPLEPLTTGASELEDSNLTTVVVPEVVPQVVSSDQNHKPELLGSTVIRHHQKSAPPPPPLFRLPADSRFGPFFEEGSEVTNVSARLGSVITMDCKIGLLGDKTVTWTHQRNQSINLLTVGKETHSKDERINLAFRYPNNYRLQISYVTRRDEGVYECQVATHPPKIKKIFLKIIAPEVKIVDESGREVHERYYRVGSTLLLNCLATSSREDQPITWKHGDNVVTRGISLNVSKTVESAVSVLAVSPLEKRHSGNYTCAVGGLAYSTVAVHVLNGELPAAVQTAGVRCGATVPVSLVLVLLCICAQRR